MSVQLVFYTALYSFGGLLIDLAFLFGLQIHYYFKILKTTSSTEQASKYRLAFLKVSQTDISDVYHKTAIVIAVVASILLILFGVSFLYLILYCS